MTHTTEQERAEFEEFASVNGERPELVARNQAGEYLRLDTATGWMWWQAARRAPVVPQGWKITEEMHVAAVKVLHRASGVDGLPQRMVDAMLAAAPQPPEAAQLDDIGVVDMAQAVDSKEAAPVQLPEPVAAESRFTTFAGDRWGWCTVEHARAFGADKGYEVRYLYTEQQVRELLAAHGIKEQST